MKKIDKVMNELKEKGKLPIRTIGEGVVLELTENSQSVIITKFCPGIFGLRDAEMCDCDYGCENCWNDEVEEDE